MLGLYHDAIHVKKNELLLLISDTFGGVSDEAFRYLRHLAATASAEGATDKTKYDTRRPWHVSFFEHHARRLSAAAALGHAAVLHKGVATARAREERVIVAAMLAAPPAAADTVAFPPLSPPLSPDVRA